MAGDETETTSEIHSDDAKKKAELENQIRKRVASEERAFRIVENLVDTTVSFERLKDTLITRTSQKREPLLNSVAFLFAKIHLER